MYGRERFEFYCLPVFALYYSGDLEFNFLFCLISFFAMIANNIYLNMSIISIGKIRGSAYMVMQP